MISNQKLLEFFFLIFSELEIMVVTGDIRGAGTTANVHLTVYGKKGVSRKLALKNKSKGCFDSGKRDKFDVEVKASILPITKIR